MLIATRCCLRDLFLLKITHHQHLSNAVMSIPDPKYHTSIQFYPAQANIQSQWDFASCIPNRITRYGVLRLFLRAPSSISLGEDTLGQVERQQADWDL